MEDKIRPNFLYVSIYLFPVTYVTKHVVVMFCEVEAFKHGWCCRDVDAISINVSTEHGEPCREPGALETCIACDQYFLSFVYVIKCHNLLIFLFCEIGDIGY